MATANSSPLWSTYSPENVKTHSLFEVLSANPTLFGGAGRGGTSNTEAGWQRDDNTLDPMQYWIESGMNGPMVTKDDPAYQKWFVERMIGGRDPQEYFNSTNNSSVFNYDPASGQVQTYRDPKIEAENKKSILAGDFTKVAGIFGGLAGGAGLLNGAWGGVGAGGIDMPWGVNAAAEGGGYSAAGAAIPELGLIANPATANAAISAGIPASMLSGGPGALTLADFASGFSPDLPPTPPGSPADSYASPPTEGMPEKSILDKITQALSSGTSASTIAKALGISEGAVSMLGKLGGAALQAFGSSQQANSLEDLAAKYQEYGAPSRARYEAGMTPGFDPNSIPGYKGAVDDSMATMLRRLSAGNGNPFGNPSGLIEANKSVVSGTALPAINEYLRLNANTGFGSSMNAAGGLERDSINANTGVLAGLASGLGSLTAPDNSLEAVLAKLKSSGIKTNFSFA